MTTKAERAALNEGINVGRYFTLADNPHRDEYAEATWAIEVEASAWPEPGDEGVVRLDRPAGIDRAHWYHPARYTFFRKVAEGVYTAYGWTLPTGGVRPATHAELVAKAAERAVEQYEAERPHVSAHVATMRAAERFGVEFADVTRKIRERDVAQFRMMFAALSQAEAEEKRLEAARNGKYAAELAAINAPPDTLFPVEPTLHAHARAELETLDDAAVAEMAEGGSWLAGRELEVRRAQHVDERSKRAADYTPE